MDGQEKSHGLDPTPEVTAKDNPGGAPPATPPAGANPADPPIGGADGAQPGQFNPEGFPAHLLGQNDRETLEKTWPAYQGARAELSKGVQNKPEKADDYQFNWSDRIRELGGVATDDAAVSLFRGIAHEHDFTQKQLDAIPAFFEKAVEAGVIAKPETPFDSAKLFDELAPEGFKGTPEQRQEAGSRRLTAADNWIRQLTDEQGFNAEMKQEMRLLTTSGAGVAVLEKLMHGGIVASVQPGGGAQPGGVTKSDLDKRVADPRNDFLSAKYDEDFAKETRELFKKVYPGTPGG